MRTASLVIILGLLACDASASGPGEAFVRFDSRPGDWVVGNGLVEREIRFDPEHGLHTSAWRHRVTGTDFSTSASARSRGSPEFSVQVDDVTLSGDAGPAALELLGADTREIDPSGKELDVRLRFTAKPIDVTVSYAAYSGHPVLRKWLTLRNRGTKAAVLTHLAVEEASMGPGPMSEIVVSGFYGTEPRESFLTGRVDDGAVVVESSRSHEGFIVMNEAPGYLKRTEINDGWRPGFKVMYDTDLFPFERVLEPGESFVTAGSSVAFFAEGRGGADPHWVMPSYGSEVLMKDAARYRPPWIYNTWEPFGRDINRAITLQLIEAAGRVGMDIFTIDDGWQARYGDNAVDLGRFPGGLDEIVRAVESRGMRLGLWVPLAAVSTAAEVYRSHPEWACTDASGKAKMTGTAGGPSVVMCLDSSYREAAAARVNDLVSRYHLRYVKLDLTTVFNAYGEAPGCNARGHGHRTWAESLEGIYEGIRYVADAVHREHPDVLLDLTFEAWGQKHLIDDGLISAANLDWLSNVGDASPGDAGPRAARKLLYDRSLAIPTETMLIGNLRAEGRQTVERVATAMGSGPLLLGDLRKLTGAEQSECGKIVAAFKALRDGIPLNEGFFPLGNWRQPSVASWDGFARLGRDGEGLVALFKNESAEEDAAFNLAAFPDGEFEVRSMLSGRSEGRFSGQQFRSGVTFPLPTGSTVELLEIRKADPAATLPSPRP